MLQRTKRADQDMESMTTRMIDHHPFTMSIMGGTEILSGRLWMIAALPSYVLFNPQIY